MNTSVREFTTEITQVELAASVRAKLLLENSVTKLISLKLIPHSTTTISD